MAGPRQMAFWVDAYNAFVLETIVNHYPINGRSSAFPANSIRQIPGAFEQATWRAAGRTVTLDQIEKTILSEFKEPRLYLALGRGAVGSGRLKSEALTGERLEKQLTEIQQEFVNDRNMLRIDRLSNQISVTPILSWREQEFAAAYDKPDPTFARVRPSNARWSRSFVPICCRSNASSCRRTSSRSRSTSSTGASTI